MGIVWQGGEKLEEDLVVHHLHVPIQGRNFWR